MFDPNKLAEALRLIADGLDMVANAHNDDQDETPARKEPEKKPEPKKTEAKKVEKAKEPEPEEEDGTAENEKVEEEEKTPATKPKDEKVKLSDLQDQAAILLAGGHRRTLKTILDEVGVKSLSTADPSTYADLKEKLAEAVEGMELT